MSTVTVSSKYQIVIPRELRRSMGIRAGQKLEATQWGDKVVLVPERDIRELFGKYPGVSLDNIREEDDRL